MKYEYTFSSYITRLFAGKGNVLNNTVSGQKIITSRNGAQFNFFYFMEKSGSVLKIFKFSYSINFQTSGVLISVSKRESFDHETWPANRYRDEETNLRRIFACFGKLGLKSRLFLLHKPTVINQKAFRMNLCFLVFWRYALRWSTKGKYYLIKIERSHCTVVLTGW